MSESIADFVPIQWVPAGGVPAWLRPTCGSLVLHGLIAMSLAMCSMQQAAVPADIPPSPIVVAIDLAAPAEEPAGAAAASAPVSAAEPAVLKAPPPVSAAEPVPKIHHMTASKTPPVQRRQVTLAPKVASSPVPEPMAMETQMAASPLASPAQDVAASAEAASSNKAGADGNSSGDGAAMAASAGRGRARSGEGDGAGSGAVGGDVMAAYLADVQARLQRNLIYPMRARKVGLHGTVHMRFTIRADGSVSEQSIVAIDDEQAPPLLVAGAIDTVRKTALKAPPKPDIQLVVPVAFNLF